MIFHPTLRRRTLSTLMVATLPIRLACGQGSVPISEAIAPPIIVRASSGITAEQFLAGFITAAARLKGAKFIACLTSAVTMHPDLGAKVVVCAFNISRLNTPSSDGHVPFVIIDQIVKAAVIAAPAKAGEIVRAAINSEPYARAWIVAAAITAAPEAEATIHSAASNTSTMSMLAFAVTPPLNPVNNGGLGPVTSPEQPPIAP